MLGFFLLLFFFYTELSFSVFIFVLYREHPILWGVEVSSGHGPREVRTSLHLSDRPLVDHVIFETGDFYLLNI